MSNPRPMCLLDKNIARRIIEGLSHPDALSDEEALVIALWRRLRQVGHRLFISIETVNILRVFSAYQEMQVFLTSVEPMEPTRYFKRWARRLRGYGFTGEDAKVLSLGTFGTDEAGQILGVKVIITLDQSFINNLKANEPVLEEKLRAMAVNLSPPFCEAVLPRLVQPREVLIALS